MGFHLYRIRSLLVSSTLKIKAENLMSKKGGSDYIRKVIIPALLLASFDKMLAQIESVVELYWYCFVGDNP